MIVVEIQTYKNRFIVFFGSWFLGFSLPRRDNLESVQESKP